MEEIKILKGDILYSSSLHTLQSVENGYLIARGNRICGVYSEIPECYRNIPVEDHSGCLIVPGFVDLHVHAPQYTFRGLGMDLELLPWLEKYTFPEEAKYSDLAYAKKKYTKFVDDLRKSETTRAVVFGTIHLDSTVYLMDLLEASGLVAFVGKVNMDRNCPEELCESSKESIANTRKWLSEIEEKYERIKPILTPRFIPSCTNELLKDLGHICKEMNLAVQSHLSENISEIRLVKELHPNTTCYAKAYDQYGLFGSHSKTIMAHAVYSDQAEEEMELLRKNQVWVAHCPESNMNLASGIAPISKMIASGIRVGIGTDVAAGSELSLFAAMKNAIQASKMRWRYVEQEWNPLTVAEVFYLATVGGGSFFGQVGTFMEGYEFDALIIDDGKWKEDGMSFEERLERLIYIPKECPIVGKYVRGRRIDAS